MAQNVAGQIQELLQISCIFFWKLVCIFLAFFCILILAIKKDLHFFALFLHFFCILIFGGPFFSCICFAFFAFISSFMFPRKGHKPTTQPLRKPCCSSVWLTSNFSSTRGNNMYAKVLYSKRIEAIGRYSPGTFARANLGNICKQVFCHVSWTFPVHKVWRSAASNAVENVAETWCNNSASPYSSASSDGLRHQAPPH